MATKLVCGRTALAARQTLRDLVELVARRDRRIEPHPTLLPNWGRRGPEYAGISHFARPLPAARLVDGTQPFIVDPSGGADRYGGSRPFEELADPVLEACWRTCLQLRPARASITLIIRLPNV